jgi:hypothetical protein
MMASIKGNLWLITPFSQMEQMKPTVKRDSYHFLKPVISLQIHKWQRRKRKRKRKRPNQKKGLNLVAIRL